jgi:hypothetical protein
VERKRGDVLDETRARGVSDRMPIPIFAEKGSRIYVDDKGLDWMGKSMVGKWSFS